MVSKRFKLFFELVVGACILATLALAGCGGGAASGGIPLAATSTSATLQYILVTPELPPVLPVGGAQQFVAIGYYSDGTTQNLTSTATWSSSSTATAIISAGGAASAVAVGSTSIKASAAGVTSLPVTLYTMQAKLVSMAITSVNPGSIGVGQPTQFKVTGTYSNGFSQDITPAVNWTSGNTAVASVNSYFTTTPGLVAGVAPGTTSIYASDILTGISATPVSMTVTNTYAVGGLTSLLPATGSVTLRDTIVNASGVVSTDNVTVNANGNFNFPATLAPGSTYNITVSSATLPFGSHACTVLDGTGIIDAITPVPAPYVQVVCGAAVGTLAGAPAGGNKDGVAGAALFVQPAGLAVNNVTGDIYVADSWNNNIRVVSASGVVRTLAGSTTGVAGYTNATGTAATFNNPQGLAFNPLIGTSGTLYVVDANNNSIRKIDIATAAVSALAGSASGVSGNANGTGTAASFNYPQGMAIDSSGNLYVADYSNNAIRKVTSAGSVSTLAGAGTFNGPTGVTVNSATGVVYVADTNNQVLKQISGTTVSTLAGQMIGGAGGFANGTGIDALLYMPSHLAIDSAGNIYVADNFNDAVRKVTPAGLVTTLAGSPLARGNQDGPVASVKFAQPHGVAVDAASNVYVTDLNLTVRKYTP